MTTTTPEESAPPALFEHCVNTYKEMLRQAKSVVTVSPGDPNALEGSDDEEDRAGQIIVYEGYFTQLVTSKLNLSVPYYTAIRKTLLEMGCIRQLKRGGGTSPSQWELIYEPTFEAFQSAKPKKASKQTKDAMIQEQLDTLSTRVSDLEDLMEDIRRALIEQFGATVTEATEATEES